MNTKEGGERETERDIERERSEDVRLEQESERMRIEETGSE